MVKGDDTLTGGAGKDTISGNDGKDIITGGGEADMIDLGAGRDVVAVASNSDAQVGTNDSAEAAYDKVSNFSKLTSDIVAKDLATDAKFQASTEGGAEADLLRLDLTEDDTNGAANGDPLANAIETDKTAAGIEGSIAGVTNTVNGVVKDGILTLTGDGASDVDTLAEWVDAAGAVAATAGETLAFEFDGNTYVYADNETNSAQNVLVELTGLTGVTGVGLADASTDAKADWILIA